MLHIADCCFTNWCWVTLISLILSGPFVHTPQRQGSPAKGKHHHWTKSRGFSDYFAAFCKDLQTISLWISLKHTFTFWPVWPFSLQTTVGPNHPQAYVGLSARVKYIWVLQMEKYSVFLKKDWYLNFSGISSCEAV